MGINGMITKGEAVHRGEGTHFNTGGIDPSLKLEGSLDRSEPRVSSTVYLIKYE